MKQEEIWKDIEGYSGDYQISNLGRVKSLKRGREKILKVTKDNKGYFRIELYKDGKAKKIFIHRLVAEAFIPNPENKPYIDHIDTNPSNNKVNNLRWCTSKENQNNSLTKKNMSKSKLGENNPMYGKPHSQEHKEKISKALKCRYFSEEHRRKISEKKKGGNHHMAKKIYCGGIIFNTLKECAEYYNENSKTMCNWLKGRRHMPKKYIDLGLRYATEEDIKELLLNKTI